MDRLAPASTFGLVERDDTKHSFQMELLTVTPINLARLNKRKPKLLHGLRTSLLSFAYFTSTHNEHIAIFFGGSCLLLLARGLAPH